MTDASPAPGPLFREIGQAQAERRYVLKSLRPLAIAVTGVLAVRVGLSIAEAVGVAMRLRVLDAARAGQFASRDALVAAAGSGDRLVAATAFLTLAALLVAYVLGGMWIYRAAANVRALGARGLETSPGWAVGWFAVPFMSMFKPLMAMSEIWRASVSPIGWRGRSTPPLLGLWWAGWLLSNLGGAAVNSLSRGAVTVDNLLVVNEVGFGSLVVDGVATGLFLAVVWGVTRAQSVSRNAAAQVAETFA
ncbi:MAG TPA: DUF4328 domain-containing protein [Caulobacteraceae bacterium]|nr:DUF4328 domain-containing protein [Caulobacteraceae bacterium]